MTTKVVKFTFEFRGSDPDYRINLYKIDISLYLPTREEYLATFSVKSLKVNEE